jgi:hypothetical protein
VLVIDADRVLGVVLPTAAAPVGALVCSAPCKLAGDTAQLRPASKFETSI